MKTEFVPAINRRLSFVLAILANSTARGFRERVSVDKLGQG
jgi:hypothetical protein